MSSIITVLKDVRDGELVTQLSDEFSTLVQSVSETGKSGVLTLVLKVRPNGERAIAVSSSIKSTIPKPAIGEAMFFTQDGNVFRRDPRQIDIEDELARNRPKEVRDAAFIAAAERVGKLCGLAPLYGAA